LPLGVRALPATPVLRARVLRGLPAVPPAAAAAWPPLGACRSRRSPGGAGDGPDRGHRVRPVLLSAPGADPHGRPALCRPFPFPPSPGGVAPVRATRLPVAADCSVQQRVLEQLEDAPV